MAANDYHVVVYQILAYLYYCMKRGVEVNPRSIEKFKDESGVNGKYWELIWTHLYQSKFVKDSCSNCRIAPLGIEYLLENSNMKMAWRFVIESDLPKIASY